MKAKDSTRLNGQSAKQVRRTTFFKTDSLGSGSTDQQTNLIVAPKQEDYTVEDTDQEAEGPPMTASAKRSTRSSIIEA